jgi:two-component system chemotaxis response regulator CheB
MPKIRVLIVDDAVVVRKMLSDTMNQDPEIEVVGVDRGGLPRW